MRARTARLGLKAEMEQNLSPDQMWAAGNHRLGGSGGGNGVGGWREVWGGLEEPEQRHTGCFPNSR